MSLEGAKLICLCADDNGQFETIPAYGKSFKFGYYMDCDVVLEHPDAMGLQCIINCDAFGRVTIENRCSDHPITLDGKTLIKMRPLLHNTEICILDKKYLWQFDGNPQPKGFQMEDINDFTTPAKQMKKPQQPPNSEPARKWRRPLHTRLTIHSFAYCIKAGENPQDVEATTDENKPLNIHERIIDADIIPNKRLSSSSSSPPPENISDFIDLNTPKIDQRSCSQRILSLSCCKLSETVITSYSPREIGTRPEKSFALVQSPLSAESKVKMTNLSIGPFHHVASPQTIQNYRPSMHLIDLITPKKLVPTASSTANRTLLKSTLKKNLPKGTSPQTPQKAKQVIDISTPGSSDTVYSVPSTDDESVIILSDDGSGSPSPIARTPPRARTPQSLMKRAILSSAKKVAVTKKLLNFPRSKETPETPKNPTAVRFQSQSTPQRKSFGRFLSSAESISAGKPRKSLITSTPFRQRTDIASSSTSRRSMTVNSQSAQIGSAKKESRNSIMLKQALSMTPTKSSIAQKHMSISCMKNQNKPRKSVSFLPNNEKEEQANVDEVEDSEVGRLLNHTFSIEDDDQGTSSHCKDATFSPEKEKCQDELQCNVSLSKTIPQSVPNPFPTSNTDSVGTTLLEKRRDSVSSVAVLETDTKFTKSFSIVSQVGNISGNQGQLDKEIIEEVTINTNIVPQTPQSLKNATGAFESNLETNYEDVPEDSDYDYDGVDEIFKTPKAKNIMILSSPKSISLQKPSSDSVELIHSTDFDMSANLDDLFQTPQSELITRSVHAVATPASTAAIEALSPEEAFDMLVGRPIIKKSYARKTPPKKPELSPLKISNDPNFPKTDIEEWIDSVNDLLEDTQDETEMSYLTRTMDEVSRDPLMMHSIAGSSNASNVKEKLKAVKTPRDEFEMTLKEINTSNRAVLKDPLETTVPRSLSPNISGIDLLDHTSESIFSETLAVSDDSSLKETERTTKSPDDSGEKTITIEREHLNVSKEETARKEIEEAFKNFEKHRKTLDEKRLASTPEPKKPSISKIGQRRTMGNQLSLDPIFNPKLFEAVQVENKKEVSSDKLGKTLNEVYDIENKKDDFDLQNDKMETLGNAVVSEMKLDLQEAAYERELESAFENFEEEPEFPEKRVVKTPEPEKVAIKDHRRTLGTTLVSKVKFDLQAAKAERELELAFENFEEIPEFSGQREVKTPEPEKAVLKDHRRTLGSALVSEVKLNLQAAKAERELEIAFENFEEEPEFFKQRSVKTPEPKKVSLKDHRRTVGSALVSEVKLDLQAAKAERELELAFENFEEEPEFLEQRSVKTPEPEKVALKHHRRTLGSALVSEVKLDLQAAKAERELELAFENFEEEPEFSEQRVVKTPEPKKVALKDHRRTLGSALVSEVKLDLQAAKAERELELAFENFEEEPEFSEQRSVKTPEPKKVALKDHRRTLGSALVSEVKLDLQAAKAERELELAFENFKEEPEFSEQRSVKTPEPKKVALKDHRRTLGSALVSEVKLDLQAAKAERELEVAFENFEKEPKFSEQRVAKTPEPKKVALKDHRRTLGSALVSEVKLDLQAAKAKRELEIAFENFEEEPEFSKQRVAKTPEPKKLALKDHRRTLGSALVSEVKLDLQAAKAKRELEVAFENFEEEPEFFEQRAFKTPEPKKVALKHHRRTLGSVLVSEVKLDLQAAKAERELEMAFENFEEEPEYSEKRAVKTPEPKKVAPKDLRRTLGSALVSEVKLDLQAAKAERELEMAFENFEEEPEFSEQRSVKTPEPKKVASKDHRRTLGSALVSEVKLDLQAAKAERELEIAFENFEDAPGFSEQRVVKTPEPKKVALKDHRKSLGNALVSEVKLDLQAAKAKRELELAFENFEEDPEFSEQRVVKTPDPKKVTLKNHRRTLGSALVSEVKLDLEAAKAERELELAFENFEEEPEFFEQRAVKTPEPKKVALKHHRRTLGSALVSEVKLDLQAAKAERELEMAFENFEEEPEYSEKRVVKTPEPKKVAPKDLRRTLGSALVSEVKLDLQAAKAERELEMAFENFEEEPEFSEQRSVKTPEPKKVVLKDHRRTLGSALVSEVKLDLQAAKAERELEIAFENFEDAPGFSEQRIVKTPEPKKVVLKDHRRSLGGALVSEVKLDLEAAKAERELELAFENFEEEPEFFEQRAVKTPEPTKVALKDHRRTLGSALVSEVKFDLQAAKAERELELAFENFEEEPEFSEQRLVKTPEPQNVALKDHRRTLGSALVSEVKLDLQAAKTERELELAFENFEEEPEFSEQRVVKTPEPQKVALKDHRRTLGSALVSEVRLDLQAAKAERELELAFENFEEEPEFLKERSAKTPEPMKVAPKDHRRTLGSALVSEVKLDLQAVKAERELELAFENFEDKPEFSEQRAVKTPEPQKVALKDHRRTVGSALVSEVRLDLQAAKAERDLELAFENFEEEPEFLKERSAKTPEPQKVALKDHRRTVGSALVSEVRLDLQAAKAERELELAFENFEEEPEFLKERSAKTPEPMKVALKDHRRTLGSALVSEVKLDLQAVKAERELELAFENFEEEPEFSEQRTVKTPEPKKVPNFMSSKNQKVSSNEDVENFENTKTAPIQRTGKKTIDSIHDVKSSFTPVRRTRQNSIDMATSDIEKTTCSNSEDEAMKSTTLKINFSDVDTTEDEANQKPQNSRSKRIRKKALKSSETPVKEIEHHNILEPIVEEGKTIESKRTHQVSESKPLLSLRAEADEIISLSPIVSSSRYRGRKAQLNVVLIESDTNTVISDEDSSNHVRSIINYVDEPKDTNSNENADIIKEVNESIPSTPLPLSSRGRRTSKTSNPLVPGLRRTRRGSVQQDIEVQGVDKVETPIKKIGTPSATDKSKEKEISGEDIVPSTPVSGLRRTRKGSIQHDIERPVEKIDAQSTIDQRNVETDGEVIVQSQSVPALRRTRKGSVLHDVEVQNVLKVDPHSATEKLNYKEVDSEDMVPSTSVPVLRRTRKGSVLQDTEVKNIDTSKTSAEIYEAQSTFDKRNINITPSTPVPALRRTRKGSVQQATEVQIVDKVETNVEKNYVKSSFDIHIATEIDREDTIPSTPVQTKTRRRQPIKQKTSKTTFALPESENINTNVEESKGNAEVCDIVDNHEIKSTKEDTDTESLIEGQEKIISAKEGPSYSMSSTSHDRKSISEQEIVPKIENSVQAQTIDDKNVSDEQIISVVEELTDKEPVQSPTSKIFPKSEIFESFETKSPNGVEKDATSNVGLKTRRRRAVVKEENVAPVAKRGRKRANETQQQQTANQVEEDELHVGENAGVEQEMTPLPSKKRGRKADIKIEPESPTPIISTPIKVLETDCTDEENGKTVNIVEASFPEVHKSLENENRNEIQVENNMASKTRGRKAAVKAENVSVEKRGRRPVAEQTSEGQALQGTKNRQEELKVHVEDCQLDSTSQEENCKHAAEIKEPMTPVPSKRRGRKAAVKVELESPTQLNTTPITALEADCIDVTPAGIDESNPRVAEDRVFDKAQELESENKLPSRTRGRRPALRSENLVPSNNRGRKRVLEHTSETKVQETADRVEEVEVNVEDCQLDSRNPEGNGKHAAEFKELMTPVPSKKRGRKAAVKVELESPTQLITTPITALEADCIDETPVGIDESNPRVAEDRVFDKAQELESENKLPSRTRGRRPALRSENLVPSNNRGRKRVLEHTSETKVQETADRVEEVEVNVEDCQLDSRNPEGNGKHAAEFKELMTPVPSKKRGRKAAVKIELESPPPVITTPTTAFEADCTNQTPYGKDESNQSLVEENVTSKTRGRRPVVKSENVAVTTGKRGRKRVLEQTSQAQIQETANTVEKDVVNVEDCQLLSTNKDKPDKISDVDKQTTPVPPIKRGRKAELKKESAAPTPVVETPVRRGGRKKPAETPSLIVEQIISAEMGSDETEEVLGSSNTGEHQQVMDLMSSRSITESSTPARRGARRNVEQAAEGKKLPESITTNSKTEIQGKDVESAKLSPKPFITRGRKVVTEELLVESSTPNRRGGRTRGVRTNVEKTVMERDVELPKSRGRKATQEIEIVGISKETGDTKENKTDSQKVPNSTKSRTVTNEITPLIQKSSALAESEQKDTDKSAVHKEMESLNDSSTIDFDNPENFPTSKRVRRAPAKLNEFIISNSVQKVKVDIVANKSDESDAEVNNSTALNKSGKKLTGNLENVDTTQEEDLTSARKRSRKEIIENDTRTESAPSRRVGRQAKAKGNPVITSIQDLQKDTHDPPSDFISDEEKSDVKSQKITTSRARALSSTTSPLLPVSTDQQKKTETQIQQKPTRGRGKSLSKNNSTIDATSPSLPVSEEQQEKTETQHKPTLRRGKALPKNNSTLDPTSPSLPVSEEKQEETETKHKPTRGRGKALSKNNSTLESTSQTEEKEPASTTKPKSNRGRKAAPKTRLEQNSNTNQKLETNQDEDEDKVGTKLRRDRKAATVEQLDSPVVTELSPVIIKKTTRGRKAATKDIATESNVELDEQPKKATQSGKEQDKETKLALKRRNLETLTSDDQQDTPSKRTRRKPIKLL